MKSKDSLFTVTVTFDFVIEAESLKHAEVKACGFAKDAFNDLSMYDIDCSVVEGANANEWDGDCIPYGGDGVTPTKDYQ